MKRGRHIFTILGVPSSLVLEVCAYAPDVLDFLPLSLGISMSTGTQRRGAASQNRHSPLRLPPKA